MILRVQKWGNSLALRIPKSFAEETRLKFGSPVKMVVSDGKIVIAPISPEYRLEELVAQINESNLHGEVVVSGRVGRESW
ncbi:MAG: AbrB/MazE/SpoVT family DNA-binding domain-containing protein [Bacillota bacterium]|nr:AbrB/MazE/SpoVT family DNA-binding domain-containing protein [Bacillota bacterium]MDI7250372.1 AbrB/MazE/SpoVT family DNA-binding domain-containing protein [Bacillota bacterium]